MTWKHRKNCAGCLTTHLNHLSDFKGTPPLFVSSNPVLTRGRGPARRESACQVAPEICINLKYTFRFFGGSKNPMFIGFFRGIFLQCIKNLK